MSETLPKRLLHQGPGLKILRSYEGKTLVPYPANVYPRQDGTNYGWVDLRGRPDLVDDVPEIRASLGLATLLRTIATPGSSIFSIGSDCGLIEATNSVRSLVSGYVAIVFAEEELNKSEDALFELARNIIRAVHVPDQHETFFEVEIEPLKGFFGRTGYLCLSIDCFGRGESPEAAWASFNAACEAISTAISRLA